MELFGKDPRTVRHGEGEGGPAESGKPSVPQMQLGGGGKDTGKDALQEEIAKLNELMDDYKELAKAKMKSLDDALAHQRISVAAWLTASEDALADERQDVQATYQAEIAAAVGNAAKIAEIHRQEAKELAAIDLQMQEDSTKASDKIQQEWLSALSPIESGVEFAIARAARRRRDLGNRDEEDRGRHGHEHDRILRETRGRKGRARPRQSVRPGAWRADIEPLRRCGGRCSGGGANGEHDRVGHADDRHHGAGHIDAREYRLDRRQHDRDELSGGDSVDRPSLRLRRGHAIRPATGLAVLHQGEMVTPADLNPNNPASSVSRGSSGGAAAGFGGNGGGVTHNHNWGGVHVNNTGGALDPAEVAKAMDKAVRSGAHTGLKAFAR